MKLIKEILIKYKMVLLYLVYGVLTTVINFTSYYFLYDRLSVPNVPSNSIAWVFAVIFAFVTNKLYVFGSKSKELHTVMREGLTFIGARIITGLIDLAIMFIAVDINGGNGEISKIMSNAIVIICNYAASKLIIFKK